jgi:hypothetical protein
VPNPSARDDEAGCGKPFPEKSKNWIQGILQDTTIFHGNQGEGGEAGFPDVSGFDFPQDQIH